MTLFGRTLGGEEIASLIFMLVALATWIMIARRDRAQTRWFRKWEADRKARRDAELALENPDKAPPPSSDGPRGPWG